MHSRFPGIMIAIAAAAGSAAISAPTAGLAQAPDGSAAPAALKTPWGEPDLQGIWTDETDDAAATARKICRTRNSSPRPSAPSWTGCGPEVLGRERRAERGTERDVSGSYNNVFVSFKHTGARTSLIVDPPNGRMPPLTPEAQKIGRRRAGVSSRAAAVDRDVQEQGGRPAAAETYDPARSPRFAEPPPRYNTARMNRNDGPEDSSLAERCLTGGLPSSEARPAASAASCRRRAASRSSTTSARARAGSATS